MLNDIGKTAIKRHQDPPLRCCGCQQTFVRHAGQLLIAGKCHIVAGIPENRSD